MLHKQSEPVNKIADLSQLHLIGQFILFLERYQPEKKEFIAKLTAAIAEQSTGGLCSGFASVALYGLWLENQPASSTVTATDTSTASTATATPTMTSKSHLSELKQIQNEAMVDPRLSVFTGDWRWSTVEGILKKISGWDGKTNLSLTDMLAFDRVIKQVSYFHYIDTHLPVAQGSLAESFADDRGNEIHQDYAVGGLFQFMDFVNKNIPCKLDAPSAKSQARVMHLFSENNPVLISSHNHAMCVLKTPKKFFCYNANNPVGMIEFDSQDHKAISSLLKAIYLANKLDSKNSAPLGLRVFRFNGEPKIYPSHEDFLQGLCVMPKDKAHFDNFTALHIAAKVGSLESANFYLTESKESASEIAKLVDVCDSAGRTAAFLAAQSGFTAILQSLYRSKADMDIPNKEMTTPLFMACQANHVSAAAALLTMKVNSNKQTDQGATALHIAAERGHIDIVKLLVAKKANPFMITDKKNLYAVDIAIANKHAEVVICLLIAMKKNNLNAYNDYMKNMGRPKLQALLAVTAEHRARYRAARAMAARAESTAPILISSAARSVSDSSHRLKTADSTVQTASAMMPNSKPVHSSLQSAAMVSVTLRSASSQAHVDVSAKQKKDAGKDSKAKEKVKQSQVHATPAVMVQARREPVLPHVPPPPNPREHEDRIENSSDKSNTRKNNYK
jgi:hypothetical protein